MQDSAEKTARAVAAIGRIDALPTLLAVLCEASGLRCAAVARVAGNSWTTCAIQDDIQLGLQVGDPLTCITNLALQSLAWRQPIVVEHVSANRQCSNASSRDGEMESLISVPIVMTDGSHFGNLCAFDPRPTPLSAPYILPMFNRFAALIAAQLENQSLREQEQRVLHEERAAGELRETFIATLGHDLRNPLQAAYACSDLLQRKLTDPHLAILTTRIKSHLSRMSGLIDDVLDFARGRLGGGIGTELTDAQNIRSGLTRVIQELEDARSGCKIISTINIDRAVRCDLGRLQQLVSNLLANALTHGRPQSPVEFTVCADREDLILQVLNVGDPIPQESLDKIFEPFWRPASSNGRNGLGLGLHICSQIVRAHEGSLEVTSSAELGTRFTARLPLALAPVKLRSPMLISPGQLPHVRPSWPDQCHG